MYINKILEQYSIENYYLVDMLIVARATKFIVPFNGQATDEDIDFYRSKIGSLMYLVVQTRPNIAYGVSVLSCFLLNLLP